MKMLGSKESHIGYGYAQSCEGCGCLSGPEREVLSSGPHSSECWTSGWRTWEFFLVICKQKVTSVSGRDGLTFAKSSCAWGSGHLSGCGGCTIVNHSLCGCCEPRRGLFPWQPPTQPWYGQSRALACAAGQGELLLFAQGGEAGWHTGVPKRGLD